MESFVGNSDAKELIRDRLQYLTSHQWPFAPLELTTIKFLQERCDPLFQVHYVSVQDTTGQLWQFNLLLMQKDGLWTVKTSSGGPDEKPAEPQQLQVCPWIRLEMLFNSNEFYAFGEILDKGYQITRVHLLEQGGLVLEDTVQDGIVLFYSDQLPTIPPIQLELYNNSGIIVSRQTQTLGSFPSVTKEI